MQQEPQYEKEIRALRRRHGLALLGFLVGGWVFGLLSFLNPLFIVGLGVVAGWSGAEEWRLRCPRCGFHLLRARGKGVLSAVWWPIIAGKCRRCGLVLTPPVRDFQKTAR